jgi:hypothetical protein
VANFSRGNRAGSPCSSAEEAKLGGRDYVRLAMDRLVAEGYASEFSGPNRARLLRFERPFADTEDEA